MEMKDSDGCADERETFSLDLSLQLQIWLIDRDEHLHGNCFGSDRCRSNISSSVEEFFWKIIRENREFSETIRHETRRRCSLLSNRPIINHHTRTLLKDNRSISLFVRLLSKEEEKRGEEEQI